MDIKNETINVALYFQKYTVNDTRINYANN